MYRNFPKFLWYTVHPEGPPKLKIQYLKEIGPKQSPSPSYSIPYFKGSKIHRNLNVSMVPYSLQ